MFIIGVDYHPSFQQIAFFEGETGECGEQQLNHSEGEAERFYRDLQQRGIRVRVGMEATGYSRWFERLLAELGFELWIGDPAEIQADRCFPRNVEWTATADDLATLGQVRLPKRRPCCFIWLTTDSGCITGHPEKIRCERLKAPQHV
jgi:hypothetical protein